MKKIFYKSTRKFLRPNRFQLAALSTCTCDIIFLIYTQCLHINAEEIELINPVLCHLLLTLVKKIELGFMTLIKYLI